MGPFLIGAHMKRAETIKKVCDMELGHEYQLRGASRIWATRAACQILNEETGEVLAESGEIVIKLKSYDTIVAWFFPVNNVLLLEDNAWNYSRTTTRHISEFTSWLIRAGYTGWETQGAGVKHEPNDYMYDRWDYLPNDEYAAYCR